MLVDWGGCATVLLLSRAEVLPHEDPADFDHVHPGQGERTGAAAQALSRLPVDVVCTGDYQPAEKKFEVSRRMLEVCLELGFPVSVLERSPLVLRGLDLIKTSMPALRRSSFFSMISAPDSPTYERRCARWRTWLRAWKGATPPWSRSRRPAF